MKQKIRLLLPHLVILIFNMYLVFFLIDRVNPAMNFIDNGLTKGLWVILCAAGIYNARSMIKRPAPAPRPQPARPAANRPYDRNGATRAPRYAGYERDRYERSTRYDDGYGRETSSARGGYNARSTRYGDYDDGRSTRYGGYDRDDYSRRDSREHSRDDRDGYDRQRYGSAAPRRRDPQADRYADGYDRTDRPRYR